jgi:hypothetical protein
MIRRETKLGFQLPTLVSSMTSQFSAARSMDHDARRQMRRSAMLVAPKLRLIVQTAGHRACHWEETAMHRLQKEREDQIMPEHEEPEQRPYCSQDKVGEQEHHRCYLTNRAPEATQSISVECIKERHSAAVALSPRRSSSDQLCRFLLFPVVFFAGDRTHTSLIFREASGAFAGGHAEPLASGGQAKPPRAARQNCWSP